MEYKKRLADQMLSDKLEAKGGVVIEGPKWCGKTTTALQVSKTIIRMDDPSKSMLYTQLLNIEPSRLLTGETPLLIDEWQIAPKLWDYVRYEIDTRGKEGQFILTGSAVPADTSEITHSGTGRFTWLMMRTMSLYESMESTGEVSLASLFDKPEQIYGTNRLDLEKLAYVTARGGWPHALDMKEKNALVQAYDYYDAVVKSDINRADGITKNPERVKALMKSLARNQGSQISNNAIKEDISFHDDDNLCTDTVSLYINALKRIYVIEDMLSWNPNLRSKTAIRTADTRYFVDPSIAIASLGLGPKDLLNDLNIFGFMFETLCVRDLRVYTDCLGGQVYHYRDKTGLKCDAVIHLRNGNYGLVEIKLGGQQAILEGMKNLKKLADKIDDTKMLKPDFMMVLIGVGDYSYKNSDGIYIVPIGCLKN